MVKQIEWKIREFNRGEYKTFGYYTDDGQHLELSQIRKYTTDGTLWYGSQTSYLKATKFVDGFAMVGVGTIKRNDQNRVESKIKYYLIIDDAGRILKTITVSPTDLAPARRGNVFYFYENGGAYTFDAASKTLVVLRESAAENGDEEEQQNI